jgi:hypothetical protein
MILSRGCYMLAACNATTEKASLAEQQNAVYKAQLQALQVRALTCESLVHVRAVSERATQATSERQNTILGLTTSVFT